MKTKEIKIRLTDHDHAKLTKAAQKLGQPLAIYLLSAALEKLERSSKPNLEDRINALEKLRQDSLIDWERPSDKPNDDRPKQTGYYTVSKAATPEQIEQFTSSLITPEVITKTDLQQRLASTLPLQKAKMIPASLMKTSVEKLLTYTKERDPDGYAWEPTNQERTIWQIVK